ncbi:serine carboxypeptidase-like 51-like [Hibiscus syriacus]|uniref:Serine carboxypeptidase-like 51-like n=1 Tax=Hibiscus syriacus TaxID=106335 RepID=A0A6A2XGQ8_HIBSY|nr:serine carboxypeptidase-like 51-like [Hibiscus syriacus]
MTSCYGPLIDLSEASHHMGHFVQLLVFVHRSSPVQYKLSKGGEIIKTDIQVGDNTQSLFSVSLWKKELRSIAAAGDIVLLRSTLTSLSS